MDRFKNMHLFKAAQSGKVARSVITLRDLILMYLSFSQSSSKKRTVASKKSKRKLRVDRKWIRNRTRKRGKNGWLKMAVGWEWPYVGKTRSNYSLEQSAIHHRTTAVLEKQLLRGDTERRFPSGFAVSFYLRAWRKMACRFRRSDTEEKISFHQRVSTFGEKDWFSRSFKIGLFFFLEWWYFNGIHGGSSLCNMAAIFEYFRIFWILCFFWIKRKCWVN